MSGTKWGLFLFLLTLHFVRTRFVFVSHVGRTRLSLLGLFLHPKTDLEKSTHRGKFKWARVKVTTDLAWSCAKNEKIKTEKVLSFLWKIVFPFLCAYILVYFQSFFFAFCTHHPEHPLPVCKIRRAARSLSPGSKFIYFMRRFAKRLNWLGKGGRATQARIYGTV